MSERRELSLFVFIDALGWELFQRYPLLDDLLAWRSPLETVLGYSCTCDPTILCGVPPREHGHFSFFYYDPPASPFAGLRWLSWLPQAVTSRGRVRRQISRWVARCHGFTGYFQLYNVPFDVLPQLDYSEKRDLYQPGGIRSGAPTLFDELRAAKMPFALSDWRRCERENLAAMQTALASGEPRMAYLYLADLDGILHADGTRSARVAEKIAWYDTQLRRLLDVAHTAYDDVRLHLFSDHGMTDVVGCCDVMGAIERLGLRYGRDYAAVYDSTMARFWLLDGAAEAPIRDCLEQIDGGRIVADDELRELGVDFPDRLYGELVFLLDPGVLLCPSYMGARPLAGMHGYDPRHPDSLATVAATHTPQIAPRRLQDLRQLVLADVGLTPAAPRPSIVAPDAPAFDPGPPLVAEGRAR